MSATKRTNDNYNDMVVEKNDNNHNALLINRFEQKTVAEMITITVGKLVFPRWRPGSFMEVVFLDSWSLTFRKQRLI